METSKRPKFHFLDGIRGLCAVYIAMYHAKLFTGYGFESKDLPEVLRPVSDLLSLGHFSISLFIVLSGFCLTIPVAKSVDGRLNGGTIAYIKRRARRILPPYYFALALFILLIIALPLLRMKQGTAWDSKIPVDTNSITSHIFLVHNLSKDWVIKINGPMWSVATEWQIYFIFPVLLILWRRYGLIASTAFGMILGLIPTILLTPETDFRWAHPWYIGLFALGMTSAMIVFSEDPIIQTFRTKINWRLLGALSLIILPVNLLLSTYVVHVSPIISETVTGGLFCLMLISYTLIEIKQQPRPFLLRMLSSDLVVKLGAFSYSIYLIHSPVLALLNLATLQTPMDIVTRAVMMQFMAVPLAVGASYLFFLLVEKRYTTMTVKAPKHSHLFNL